MFAYLVVAGLARLVSALPLRASLALGRGVGSFVFHVVRLRRGVVLANLRHTLGGERPERDLRALGAEVYRNAGMTFVEVLRASSDAHGPLHENVGYDALESFEKLRDEGRPVVIVQPHMGNFDLAAYGFAMRGFPLHTVMIRIRNRRLHDLIVRTREAHGITVHVASRRIYLTLRRVLRRGGWVGILPDQRPRREHGVEVCLLGRPARIFPGPALLHLDTGAPLFLAISERLPGDPRRHHVHIRSLEPPPSTGDREADVRAIMQAVADGMSEAIRRNPGQYFWFHRLWGKDIVDRAGLVEEANPHPDTANGTRRQDPCELPSPN